MRVQRVRLAILGTLLIGLPVAAVAQVPPSGPCAPIVAACRQAGFAPNAAGPSLPPVAPPVVAACQAGNPQFGQGDTPRAPAPGKGPVRIMPLGDSITYGTPDPNYGGYRHALGALLRNERYRVAFVGSQQSGAAPDQDNEGHPGWTIAQLQNGIAANGWLEKSAPDIVLLHIGTNDLRLGRAAAAPAHLTALLDDILARLPRAHVIVAQIIPFRAGPDPNHQAYNAALASIVAAKGPRVALVDMRTILVPGDYADGLHPKRSGYDKMARAWEAAIRAVLAGPSRAGGVAPAAPGAASRRHGT